MGYRNKKSILKLICNYIFILFIIMTETTKDKVDECKKYNDILWKCIETNNYTINKCGKHYYKFFKCFNTIGY